MRHLVIFALLTVAAMGVLVGLHRDPVWSAYALLGTYAALFGLFLVYFLFVMALAVCIQLCWQRSPVWADRLARLQAIFIPGHHFRVNLLALHSEDGEKSDNIWKAVEPDLAGLKPGLRLALVVNYSVSLSARGRYSAARKLLLENEPTHPSKAFAAYYTFYWLNLGWFQHKLGAFDQLDYCVRRAEQESLKHDLAREHLDCLRSLLARENGHLEEARQILRDYPVKSPMLAWFLVDLGDLEAAADKMPPEVASAPRLNQNYYFLAKASIAGDRSLMQFVNASYAGQTAYHAIKHFNDSSYLEQALQNDPESIWTQRAQAAGS